MFFYTASTVLKFSALVRLRTSMADMPRPFSIPGGTVGVTAMSVPPVLLCLITIMVWRCRLTLSKPR